MIYSSTFFGFATACCISLSLFYIKYQVIALEDQITSLHQSILTNEESLHLLKAEYAHLKDPRRLQKLNAKYLNLKPLEGTQLLMLDQLLTLTSVDPNWRVTPSSSKAIALSRGNSPQ